MSMMKSIAAAVALTLSLAAPLAPAEAQSARGAADQPIMYGADDGEYTPTGISLRGRAEVTQGQNRLRADAIEGAILNGDITSITANGNVYFVTPQQTMRGDRAVYTIANNTVVVTGDVILTQGKNVLTGARLTYNVQTGAARMDGAGRGGGRVQGVFYPENGSN